MWFILGLGKLYVSITLGSFFVVSGVTCLCIRFLSVLWLLLAGMVRIIGALRSCEVSFTVQLVIDHVRGAL